MARSSFYAAGKRFTIETQHHAVSWCFTILVTFPQFSRKSVLSSSLISLAIFTHGGLEDVHFLLGGSE